MEYNFREIEKRWQKNWKDSGVYKVNNPNDRQEIKPKFYVLDMFPYPSGAGLHVGHPLGYIASDIYARYKRLKGFNVLHPMGYDSFGLPAEQYALETGQHPAVTTEKNIETFRQQLDNIGFSFDWSRELRTSDPKYYKWTQWIFLKLFNSYFCNTQKKARPISELVAKYETKGCNHFTSGEWKSFSEIEKSEWLMKRRLAYSAYGEVNWCEALGTVLANDEVINGVSERGGHPVVKKKMRQWYLRITAYAERLLEGLETVEFSDAMKEMQRNWIGKSEGAEMEFIVSLTPNPSPKGEGNRSSIRTAELKIWPQLKDLSRENRKEKTLAEDILWQRLRNNQYGSKVRRQHVIDGFIIDFAFLNEKLLIEVDGRYHDDSEQKKYDESRTEYLQQSGYRILRFTNDEVRNNFKKVSEVIKEELAAFPLSARRGDGGEAKKSEAFSKPPLKLKVYTTRPDTIFGVDFMVLAPEHELVNEITTDEQRQSIDEYLTYVRSRSDRERMAEVKQVTGCFTGAYAINPFDGRKIPIWIAEYVLAGYGTGAIMAVPCGDQRDYDFAKHFNIPITNIIGEYFNGEEANPTKEATLINSGFLNGIKMKGAIDVVLKKIEEEDIGRRKINYKMRDAGFSRQRYWGEPFPIVYHNGIAYPLDEKDLPIKLPHVENYKPGPEGEGPLANITDWVNLENGDKRETNTMPGYAGSSWYFLRYMDPHNDEEFADRKATDYWSQVDVYVGGTEHAVGHLLYSRMWTKVLYDLGLIGFDEPFKKLVNQGMIQGSSRFIYRVAISAPRNTESDLGVSFNDISSPLFLSHKYVDDFEKMNEDERLIFYTTHAHDWDGIEILKNSNEFILLSQTWLHVNVNMVDGIELNFDELRNWKNGQYANAKFVLEDGKYICGVEVEKMSKSKYNVINPNDLIEKYGADTFRMYEMFLGPVEQSKPWDTKGIEGVHRFLKKLWRLFYDDTKGKVWNEEKVSDAELKVLHKAIKKIEDDTERFSYNTAVSAFMVCVNELTDLKCYKKEILEPLLILLTPYAPHIAEELFRALGNSTTVLDAVYPKLETKYLIESEKEYPVSINGKMRTTIAISLDATQDEVEKIALNNDIVQKWIEGKMPKKIIYVKNKMINVVI
jgi:leucyl-tRNA synthetase